MIHTPWFHQLAATRAHLFKNQSISKENLGIEIGIKNEEKLEILIKRLELSGEVKIEGETLHSTGLEIEKPKTLPQNDLEKMLAWQAKGISNMSQILCLLLIARAGNEKITPTEISKRIYVCTAAMTGIQKQLEKDRLITKAPGINGRSKTLLLTGEGARLILSIYGSNPIW